MGKIFRVLFGGMVGAGIGVAVAGKFYKGTIEDKDKKVDKFKGYYNMLNQWMILKKEGKTLASWFVDNGYRTIAIYGMGEMGNRLYDELQGTEIKVLYAVDKNGSATYSELDVVDLEDELENVDAMVVTSVFAFDEIKEQLCQKVDFPIVSLEDIIFEV